MTSAEPTPEPTLKVIERWEPPTTFFRQIHVVAMGMLILVLMIHLLKEFATILQQLLIAGFVLYLIHPARQWLARRGLSPLFAGIVLLLAFLGATTSLGLMVSRSVEDLKTNLERYQERLQNLVKSTAEQFPALDPQLVQQALIGDHTSRQANLARVQGLLGSSLSFFSAMVLTLVYLGFLLSESVSFPQRVLRAFPPERAGKVMSVIERINSRIAEYISVKTFVSVLGGVLTWLVLVVVGVDYAELWGVLAFMFNYIPYVGSLVATVLPILLALVQFDDAWWAVLVLVLLLLVQYGIAYFIEPKMAGSRLNLSPLVILLSLAFWGSLWGIIGMILAVPLVVVIKTILENIEETKFIGVLLSNK